MEGCSDDGEAHSEHATVWSAGVANRRGAGVLKPLPLPRQKWQSLGIDFLCRIPMRDGMGFDSGIDGRADKDGMWADHGASVICWGVHKAAASDCVCHCKVTNSLPRKLPPRLGLVPCRLFCSTLFETGPERRAWFSEVLPHDLRKCDGADKHLGLKV